MRFTFPQRVFFFACIFIFSLFTACTNSAEDKLASSRDTSVVLFKGSESELKLISFLTDEYKKTQPGIKFEISGGGSSVGIDALVHGTIDVANSSRIITQREMRQAHELHVNPLQVIIALDAVSIITHPKVGIDSLSIPQLSRLFSGEIKNWKEIGGFDLPVVLIGRNENSGTYHYMLNRLGIDAFATTTKIEAGNTEIVEQVSTQQGAIGYVNLGSIFEADGVPCKTVWVAGIYFDGAAATSPYNVESVRRGDYPLTRPLYQYVNEPLSWNVSGLIHFELSAYIQSRLEAHGYFPVTPIYKAMNRKNGFSAD